MIEAKGLSKNYGNFTALSRVSFSIGANEVVGLLGPNGAGKTTLMKILTGYMQPTEGFAMIAGIDVVEDPLGVQAQIGYLPENAPTYHDMVVQEYLMMIAELRLVPSEKRVAMITEAVERTGLQDYLVKPIGKLSKGYRQRVGLAQAILHKPKVLILDEPTTGLDPNQIVEIRALIQELSKSATVLLSTHILPEVELTCERVLMIFEGCVRRDARLDELQSGSGAIVSVESSATGVEDALRTIDGVSKVVPKPGGNGFRSYRVTGNTIELCPKIFDVVKTHGWRIAELRPDQQTLEMVFRNVGQGEELGAAS